MEASWLLPRMEDLDKATWDVDMDASAPDTQRRRARMAKRP